VGERRKTPEAEGQLKMGHFLNDEQHPRTYEV
jgi:hypothetical protein